MSASILLYSTNPFIKLWIQEKYRGDVHYVWCSENFDSRSQAAFSPASLVAPSSNPAQIFRNLREAVARGDKHNKDVIEFKLNITARATLWEKDGSISKEQMQEIFFWAADSSPHLWQPLLYVIPCTDALRPRLQRVAPDKRASQGDEWVIPDLRRSEFHVVDLSEC